MNTIQIGIQIRRFKRKFVRIVKSKKQLSAFVSACVIILLFQARTSFYPGQFATYPAFSGPLQLSHIIVIAAALLLLSLVHDYFKYLKHVKLQKIGKKAALRRAK